ncbi:sensor histidine kinase [Paenibacillus oryzisoli]|uniref:Signal transduction histidine kinase internal region domain-containing protein n=1 Tax=Paenibacillus oryzisoli TaxID=1850517 RepID=A0A197ZWT2_9BACL|nr:histidine kinase [Paenibacillus oryzisoli]OAS13276.1 hypothetical protein A8708_10790 [Paenibacillus oryzisoli]
MLNKFKNIQTILFTTYSLIIIIVFTVLVVWIYLWVSDLLRENATDSIYNLAQSTQEKLDLEIQKMDAVTLDVMYSNLVKDLFIEYTSGKTEEQLHASTSKSIPMNNFESSKELADILAIAIGPSRPVDQVYLYDFMNSVYANGIENGHQSYDPTKEDWYKTVTENKKGKFIHPPVPDEKMSKFLSSNQVQYSISLFRLFYDQENVAQGIVEVKQYYNHIFKSIMDYLDRNPNREKIIVFDDSNHIIYPLNMNQSDYEPYITKYSNYNNDDKYTIITNPTTKEKEMLSIKHSQFTRWNVAIIISEKKLLAPLSLFAKRTVFVAILILIFAILLSFFSAKRITLPILKIHRTIRNIRLEDIGYNPTPQQLNSGLNELDQLHLSFINMNSRLKNSMNELLLSQAQELQSKMIALQSQMNPHFLYNTIMTIRIMAEENMNSQIIEMSDNLSDMLRYISSDESLEVDIATELHYTEKYINIHQIRYGSQLQYSFEIDPNMLDLKIPKLIIQPLVENALKFVTRKASPWHIHIVGTITNNNWQITVSDNGLGFNDQQLNLLYEKIEKIEQSKIMPGLKLNGMGLLNIYLRLKLQYQAKMVFRIAYNSNGGASVTIGGFIVEEE